VIEMSFNERQAIEMEMQELKETARREFEMYFESKKWRNERFKELQERLKELDKEEVVRPPIKPLSEVIGDLTPVTLKPFTTANCDTPTVETDLPEIHNIDISVEIPQWETTETPEQQKLKEEMQEANTKTLKRNYVPLERVIPVVIDYLIVHGESRIKDIQEYVERKLETKWISFSPLMGRIIEKTNKIENTGYGLYKYIGTDIEEKVSGEEEGI
jgi:hypothetical protein